MYYESYKPRRPKRQRTGLFVSPEEPRYRRRRGCLAVLLGGLFRLILIFVLLAALACGALYALPVSFFLVEDGEGDYALTDGLPTDAINILLIGTDTESEGMIRSDTMLVASVSYSGVRLTSLLRDTMVDIPGYGRGKLNSAYARGGAELLMKTVNLNFSLNINHYIRVDYVMLVDAVNAMGGIDVDITEAEMTEINGNVLYSARVFRPLGYVATELREYGEGTHLDGLQALGYARIRKLDSDFVRASRQRTVLTAMLGKVRSEPWHLLRLIPCILEQIDTNLSYPELISYGLKILFGGEVRQMRLPVDGSYTDNGSALIITDMDANVRAFREFAYGE